MKRGDVLVTVVQGLALLVLAMVLFFPAIVATSLNWRELWSAGGLGNAGDFSFVTWLGLLLSAGDAGSLGALCSNFLRTLAFFSLLALLVVPGEWPRHLKKLYLGCALFLGLGLLAVYFGCAPYDGILAWGNCAGVVCAFVSASALAYRADRRSLLRKTVIALEIAALVCMVWAWRMYAFSSDAVPVMYGNFYNQNMLSGWLLLVLPGAVLGLASGADQRKERYWPWLNLTVLVATGVTLYFGYNRTAWAVGAFVALLAIGLDGRLTWRNVGVMATLSGAVVVAAVAAAVLVVQGCWWGAAIAAVVALLALAGVIAKSTWIKRKEVKWRLALAFVLGIVLACLIGTSQTSGLSHAAERLQDLSSGEDSSGLARLEFYRCAWEMSLDHPLLGVGPQGFLRLYPSYQQDLLWYSRHTHCTCLDILCEYGFVNTLVFLGVMGAGLVLAVRSCRSAVSNEARCCLGAALGCLALFLHAQGDVDLFFVTLPMTGALVAGVLLGPSLKANEEVVRADASQEHASDRDQAAKGCAGDRCQTSPGCADRAGDRRQTSPSGADRAGDRRQTSPSGADRAVERCQTSPGCDQPRGLFTVRPSLWRQYGVAVLVALALMLNVRCTVGDYYGTYARYFREHRQMALAVDYYRSAAQAVPFNSEYQVRLVQSILESDLLESSGPEQYEKIGLEIDQHSLMAVYHDPQRALCHSVRGQALEQLGRWEEALACYQTALDLDHTTSPEAFYDVTRAFLHLGEKDKARQCLQYLLQHFPSVLLFRTLMPPVFHVQEHLDVQELLVGEMQVTDPQCWSYIKRLEEAGYPAEFIEYLSAQWNLRWEQVETRNKRPEQAGFYRQKAQALLRQLDATHPNYRQTRKLLEQCR